MPASRLKSALLAMALLASIALMISLPARAELTNPGFETGDLTGWESIGQVGVSDEHPNEGSYHAILVSSGATVEEIETFLGLEAGDIAGVINGSPTNGAAIKQTFTGTAGDEIELSYNFLNNEGIGMGGINDSVVAALVIQGGAASVVLLTDTFDDDQSVTSGSITSPFSFSWALETGYRSYSVTLPESGELTLGFAVLNVGDTLVHAGLMLDGPGDGQQPPPPSEPRPVPSLSQWSLLLTTLLLGALGLVATRRRNS